MGNGEGIPLRKSAAQKYVREVVYHLKGVLEVPVDAYTPQVPPWD
jgi:hypothetical protein